MKNIKWIFFDLGSTLVDESKVQSERFKRIAASANVSYDYVYQIALNFYKQNKKGGF